ncbi:MAG: hypothetical protein DRN08_00220 [Thermoplasmata archaeon]|nr:MAG: hypothetical protein DRN08_00220 [Thermoplasmata archaeon]
MKKALGILLIITLFVVQFAQLGISEADTVNPVVERHTVEINPYDNRIIVEESIKIKSQGQGNENYTSIRFWIQQDADDVKILAVGANKYLTPTISGNIYEINLTEINTTLSSGEVLDVTVSYNLPATNTNFEKKLFYDTVFFSVTFNNRELCRGEDLSSNSYYKFTLYRPYEVPMEITYIIIIVLLIIILIVSTLYLLKKQRTRLRRTEAESEELLTTKKTLLLSILKDIEKQHRSKKISDETYSKLREEYKQQAVDVIKKLEEKNK